MFNKSIKAFSVTRTYFCRTHHLVRHVPPVNVSTDVHLLLHPCMNSPNVMPARHASLLSYFRREKKDDKNSEKENKPSEEDGWINAVQDADQSYLKLSDQPDSSLTRTEIRAWKKRAFLHIIEVFLQRKGITKRGFNNFIQNALEKMPEYEVADDLECYKAVIRVFPTGRMVVTSYLQAEWGHYRRQQQTMIKLLQQMARNHVLPDDQVGQMIIDIFGWRNHAMQHYRHMMYWVPKLYYSNPWPVPVRILDHLDQNPIYLAKLIAERICPDRNTEFSLVQMNESPSSSKYPNCLISAQSPDQRNLLAFHTQAKSGDQVASCPIYVDGPNYVWFRNLQAAYYTMWTEIDDSRLEREAKNVDELLKYRPCNSTEPWNLKFFGRSTQSDDVIPNVVHKFVDKNVSLPDILQEKQSVVQKSATIPGSLPVPINNAEPEFDNRWLTLRQAAQSISLPNQLSIHEQAEGVILAVAIIVPKPDALDNQKKFYSDQVSKHSGDANLNTQASGNFTESSNTSTIPRTAPSVLIRNWVSHLRATNPGLDQSTLLIRVQNEPTSYGNDSVHEDYNIVSEDGLKQRSKSV